MIEPSLAVNAPAVVAEIIDGEAVIMDLASGHYFSTRQVGCDIWRGIESGYTRSAIARSLLTRYTIDPASARSAVDSFVDDLMMRGLIVETNRQDAVETDTVAAPTSDVLTPFAAPVLDAYTDMEELLLLDPIHDVDQAGWPMPKTTELPQ